MIKHILVGFCWNFMLLWSLDADFESTLQFKGSERSPGFFQDFEDEYMKF